MPYYPKSRRLPLGYPPIPSLYPGTMTVRYPTNLTVRTPGGYVPGSRPIMPRNASRILSQNYQGPARPIPYNPLGRTRNPEMVKPEYNRSPQRYNLHSGVIEQRTLNRNRFGNYTKKR